MKTFKVLSALLDYPDEALVRALPELRAALDAEGVLPQAARDALEPLLHELENDELLELQARYVGLFDRVRSLSLHLFEHVHGESRDRGQALVDLTRLYADHGYVFEGKELPDYLPAFLEFLSRLAFEDARELLAETGRILDAISVRLERRASAYAAVLKALLVIAGCAYPQAHVSDDEIRAEDDPVSIDASWEEAPAFGPAPACGAVARPATSVVQVHRRAA